MSTVALPYPKRRKVAVTYVSQSGTQIRADGTITPSPDAMDTEVTPAECPCGHLHGPGVLHGHDVAAVGFSSNLMRGPE